MDNKYTSLIAKYLSGDIEDRERETLFELVNSSEENRLYFEEMENLWDLSGEEEELVVDTDKAWQKVALRINPSTESIPIQKNPGRVFKIGQLLKIAAVFIGVLGAIWIWNNIDNNSLQNVASAEEKLKVDLPDGSTVWLNKNSKLSYEKDFEPRIIHLEGEAFFEVEKLEKGQKFEIRSGETTTTVLGTSFNVRAYPEEDNVEVTVKTGKVAFESKKEKAQVSKKVVLLPGQSAVFKKKEATVEKIDQLISNADGWKKEELNFEDAKMSEVIKVLERYFDLEIETQDERILNCPFRGEFPNPNINQFIEIFEFTLEIDIERTNDTTLTLSGQGCE